MVCLFRLPQHAQNCGNCRYGLQFEDDGEVLFECHRHAPTGPDAIWPLVMETPWPWCGEWVQQEVGDA